MCVKLFWYIFKIGYKQLKQLIQIYVILKKNTYYSLSATEDAYGKAEREIQLKWSSDRD